MFERHCWHAVLCKQHNIAPSRRGKAHDVAITTTVQKEGWNHGQTKQHFTSRWINLTQKVELKARKMAQWEGYLAGWDLFIRPHVPFALEQDVNYQLSIFSLFPCLDFVLLKPGCVSVIQDHLQKVYHIERKICREREREYLKYLSHKLLFNTSCNKSHSKTAVLHLLLYT